MAKQASLTQSMSELHTWAGLVLGWVLFAIFLTGTLAVFDKELNWWMQPELRVTGQSQAEAVQVAEDWLRANHTGASAWNIGLPSERGPGLSVSAGEQRRGERTYLDASTGELVEPRDTAGGSFFFRFHYTLHMGRDLGVWIVGLAGMAMLVAIISGIIIHKKIFKDFFTFRPGKGQRSWLDGHNASAVLLLPFHLMITYTGLVIFFLIYMPAATDALYNGDRQAMFRDLRPGSEQHQQPQGQQGQAQAERDGRSGQGERVGPAARGEAPSRGEARAPRTVEAPPAQMLPLAGFIALGEAHYGAGMLSSISVSNPDRANAQVEVRPMLGSRIELTKGESMAFNAITGAALRVPEPSRATLLTQRVMAGLHFAQFGGYPMRWLYFICGLISCAMIASGLVLYTVKRRRQAKVSATWLRQADWLNTTVVAGLMVACVAMLWANRLLPVELAERSEWEQRVFFGSWLLTLLHARVRAPSRAWIEQLAAGGLLLLALPLLDFLLAARAADVLRLSVDVTAAVCGALLLWVGWRVAHQPAAVERAAPRKTPKLAKSRPEPAGAQS